MSDFLCFCNRNLLLRSSVLTSFIIFNLLSYSSLYSQSLNSGWVYIENVQTGMVMDVQGNVKTKGTTVLPHSLNYSKAQIFRLTSIGIPDKFGTDAFYIMAYDNNSLRSSYFVSAKIPPLVTQSTSSTKSDLINSKPQLSNEPLLATDGSIKSTHKRLNNYIFTIEDKSELSNPRFSQDISTGTKPKQIWRVIPVPNEPDVYYIQSAQFDKLYAIEPLDLSSNGTLVLGEFSGINLQKWRILKTAPNNLTNLKITNFEWDRELDQSTWKVWEWHAVYNIEGELSWESDNDNADITKQRVTLDIDNNSEHIFLEPHKRNYKFNFESTSTSNLKEHCFTVKAYSKWAAENTGYTFQLCAKPNSSDPPAITPPKGVSKLLITNCHTSKTKSVRLWLYDVTTNNGNWEDKGVLNNQWQNNNCPSGAPKEINLTDNHIYILKAIDCGDLPPNETFENCDVLTSPQIKGESNGEGTTLTFSIGGDS